MAFVNNSPIFVVGAGRSGTTLTRMILDSHPRICSGPEFKLLPSIADLYEQAVGPLWFAVEGYDNSLADVQESFRNLIYGLTRKYATGSGKPRWAEKTPQNIDCMATLGKIFPDAQFVHLIRDGRDVACSLITMNWINVTTGRKAPQTESIAAAARYWRDAVLSGRRQSAEPVLASRVMEMRYENLVNDPAATIRGMLNFLGEQWDDAVLAHHTVAHKEDPAEAEQHANTTKSVNKTALARWQRDMTAKDKADFKAAAGELLIELGYAENAEW